MAPVHIFRALVIGEWLVSLALAAVEVALPGPGQPGERLANEVASSMTAIDVAALLLLPLSIVASVGLWRFRAWGPTVFAVSIVASALWTLFLPATSLSGLAVFAILVHGAILGAIAAWLTLARHTLPFARE